MHHRSSRVHDGRHDVERTLPQRTATSTMNTSHNDAERTIQRLRCLRSARTQRTVSLFSFEANYLYYYFDLGCSILTTLRMLWKWDNDCHILVTRTWLPRLDATSLAGWSRLDWDLGMFPFLFLKLTNIFITQSRNRNFLELLDAFISTFGRIYLGHCDFNSSPITLLTFFYFISIEFSALDYRVKIFCLYVESSFCSCPFAALPQGHRPSNICGRKVVW
jgi:hypothetical protein